MTTKHFAATVLALFILVACKKERSADESKEDASQLPRIYEVIVDLVIDTDDDLIIYYKDGQNQWFVEEKAVWRGAIASPTVQQVVFPLPEDIVPNDIRFDIGRNDFKEKTLEIKNITLRFRGKEFNIPQDQVMNFFKPNQYIEYNQATKKFTFKKDEEGNFDPFFETKPELYPQLLNVAM